MAVTIAYDMPRAQRVSRDLHEVTGTLTFDTSYPNGGESIDLRSRLKGLKHIAIEPAHGISFQYDYTERKAKAFKAAPPIIWEEVVDCDDDLAYLKYPAAFIISVTSANTAHKVIDGSLTPAAGQVAVNIGVSAGVITRGQRCSLTFPSGEGAATTYVTYITQAWTDVMDNLVHAKMTAGARVYGHADLEFTAGTPDKIDLGETACAIQNVTWDDNGTVKDCDALYKGEDPATTETAIDFTAASGFTDLAFKEEDTVDASTDSVYITYIRKPSSGFLKDRFVEENDLTPSSDVITSGYPLLIFGSCGGLPGATTKFTDLLCYGATVGATATNIKPTANRYNTGAVINTFTLGSGHGDTDHIKPSVVWGHPSEIACAPLEVPVGESLAHIVTRFSAVGIE